MTQSQSISWDDLHQLFSVVMCIDESMSIIYASETLSKCIPEANTKPLLSELFKVVRPSSLTTFSEGSSSVGSLCLLTAKNNKFAIRGQLLNILYKGKNVLCFCGAPWLFWINSHSPDTHLGLSDFAAQDVQLDQLFFMSTERQMVNDLEQLNIDLQAAKQQLEQSQEAQKQFFAQMSHEIRTPLNGVVSALSLLGNCTMDEEPAKFVRLALSSSENLMQVINYVLSISKLELSPLEDQMVINLKDLIQSTADIVRAKAEEKSIDIQLNLSNDLPHNCYSNTDRLRQTLLNLLVNAIKFTDKGSVTVSARPLSWDEDECILRVEVIDTGVGIPEKDQQNIFNPFWSSQPKGDKKTEEGTGLGLDIVRRNVKSMGGQIQMSSEPGEGTRFWFDIPVAVPDKAEEKASSCASQPNENLRDLEGKVLLVDDNETNLILGTLILESLGVEVASADCGLAAVTAAKEGDFDLVLMDISMPDISGLEATRRIRHFLDNDQLPILALTAHIDVTEKEACLKGGMDGYLTKPIEREALHEALSTWLPKDGRLHPNKGSASHTQECKEILTELVDEGILDNLAEQIGCDNLQVVIDKVQAESALRWNELIAADLAGDRVTTQRNVHSLASIFRSVGLISMGDGLGEIEIKLRAGNELLPGWLEEFDQLRRLSMTALTQRLEEMSRSASAIKDDTN